MAEDKGRNTEDSSLLSEAKGDGGTGPLMLRGGQVRAGGPGLIGLWFHKEGIFTIVAFTWRLHASECMLEGEHLAPARESTKKMQGETKLAMLQSIKLRRDLMIAGMV